MKITGTHNSLSYLPVKKWWMKPLNIIAKCQSKDIKSQISEGSRCFDIRVRFDKDGIPYLCHGAVQFDGDVFRILNILNFSSYYFNKKIYIRLILETSREDLSQEFLFRSFVESIKNKYPNITFFELRRKYDWTRLMPSEDIPTVQYVNSIRCKWIFIPWLYAKLFKRKHLKEFINSPYKDNITIYLFDFI